MFRGTLGVAALIMGAAIVYAGYSAGDVPPQAIQFATCDNPSKTIVPDGWKGFSPDGPSLPIPAFHAGNDKQIELVENGRMFVDKRGAIIELDDVDWATNDHNYVSTQLHGFAGIGYLVGLQKKLPSVVEEAIGTHILNWAYCAAHHRDINPRAWFEGTVIKRQANLLEVLNYTRKYGSLPHLPERTLLYLIDADAAYLLDTDDVYSFGNHGIRQDMLLAATALSLPGHPRADEMLALARDRLDEAADKLFTDSGIWLEHAPGYVHYAVRLMDDIERLHEAAPEFNPKIFLRHLETSRNFLFDVLQPDRTIPPVGRSAATRVSYRIASNEMVENKLAQEANSLSVFPEYGEAIIRGGPKNDFYLLFVASQNLPAGKRHEDNLSVLLSAFGRPWITEGGHESYEDSGVTRFLRTPLAHSSYTLDGEYLGSQSHADLDTRITESREAKDGFMVEGFTERFREKASMTRRISVDRAFSTVHMTDTLSGAKSGKWVGRLQIPGDLSVSIEGQDVRVDDPSSEHGMHIRFDSDAALTLSKCRGEEKPICGWGQNEDGFGPVSTLMWMVKKSAKIDIALTFDDES